MDDATVNVLVAGVAAVALVLAGWWMWQRQRTRALRHRYAGEYDRTVSELGRRRGEAELVERQRRVNELIIRPISEVERRRFVVEWRNVQEQFVDDPGGAVARGHQLIDEVMRVRGYPIADFDRQAEDLSVHHPGVVENYRVAREITRRRAGGTATTEDLRQAMVLYRELFDDLLTDESLSRAERAVPRTVEREEIPTSRRPIARRKDNEVTR